MKATIVLLFILMMGCQAGAPATNDNEMLVHDFFDAFNRHAWTEMAGYYTDTASFLDPSFGTEYINQSRAEVIAKYAEMQKMFPDLHDEVVGVWPAGDKVTVEFISTGTGPGGKKFKLPIVTVLTIRDKKIIRDATYYDL